MTDWRQAGPVQQVKAMHPHWTGTLVLDHTARRIRLREHGSTGSFAIDGDVLTVQWDTFSPDTFLFAEGRLIERSLSPLTTLPKDWNIRTAAVVIEIPGTNLTAELRIDDSDVQTYRQIFVAREYDIDGLPEQPRTIVDLGANIGLSVLWFALKYPAADVIALEPDPANFRQLQRNTLQLGRRAQVVNAAIWYDERTLSLKTHADDGHYLQGWGAQTVAIEAAPTADTTTQVAAWPMGKLRRVFGFERIDILKVDIEGAERELFAAPDRSWLDDVETVVIETHDRFRPGSHAAVTQALAQDFVALPQSGENHVFRRRSPHASPGRG